MPCHGLLSYEPARLVQSGAVYLSNCRGSLQSGPNHSIEITLSGCTRPVCGILRSINTRIKRNPLSFEQKITSGLIERPAYAFAFTMAFR